jgi:hypothetical protein
METFISRFLLSKNVLRTLQIFSEMLSVLYSNVGSKFSSTFTLFVSVQLLVLKLHYVSIY